MHFKHKKTNKHPDTAAADAPNAYFHYIQTCFRRPDLWIKRYSGYSTNSAVE